MPLYRCDWPNHKTSLVHAKTKADAVLLLDDFGAATPTMLSVLEDFMVTIAREEAVDEEDADTFVITEVSERTYDALEDVATIDELVEEEEEAEGDD